MDTINPKKNFTEKTRIVLSKIYQHLRCSICLNWMTNPVMTQCGHRYCNECVLNAIKAMPPSKENNYFCKCPLCGQKITKRSLIKQDHLFEIVEQTKSLIEFFEKKHPALSVVDAPAVFEASQLNHSFHSDTETSTNQIQTTPNISSSGRRSFKRPLVMILDDD